MANLVPFLAYVLATTFTPGPNNILAMSNAMRYGYRRTLGFLLGMTAGFFLIMLLSGLLNAALATWLPETRSWLNLLGAVYLVFLAIHVARSDAVEAGSDSGNLNSFAAGLVLQFLNPKAILYGITVFSLFIIPTFREPLVIGLFAVALASLGFVAVSSWALGGNLFRHALRKHYRLFNFAMAGLLVYTAVAALLSHAPGG